MRVDIEVCVDVLSCFADSDCCSVSLPNKLLPWGSDTCTNSIVEGLGRVLFSLSWQVCRAGPFVGQF